MRRAAALAALLLACAPGVASAQRIIAPTSTVTVTGSPDSLVVSFEVGTARHLVRAFETTGLHRERTDVARTEAVSALLCDVPCSTEVDAGVYKLRVGVPGRGDASVGEVFLRPGAHRLVGHFESHADLRAAGGILLIPAALGLTVTLLLLIAGPLAWIGVGISAAVLGVAIGLVAVSDDARLDVDP